MRPNTCLCRVVPLTPSVMQRNAASTSKTAVAAGSPHALIATSMLLLRMSLAQAVKET